MHKVLEAAQDYLTRGLLPIPVGYRKKVPTGPWKDLRADTIDVERLFAKEKINIGIRLGELSGGLVDIDLDSPKARCLAHRFLPKTGAIFGRESSRRSHWLYRCKGLQTKQFKHKKGGMIAEIRSDGKNGGALQTVFPPSVHESGESITWESDGDPAEVDSGALLEAVGRLAAASLLAIHAPEKGVRNEFHMAIAGVLAREGWPLDDSQHFIDGVFLALGEPSEKKWKKVTENTYKRLAGEKEVTGLPTLRKLSGEAAVDTAIEWLGFDSFGDFGLEEEDTAKEPQFNRLTHLLSEIKLWCSKDGRPYATVTIKGYEQHLPVESNQFKQHVMVRYVENHQGAPQPSALNQFVTFAAGKAQAEGEIHDTVRRVGLHEGCVYIDLCDGAGSVVRISAQGWEVQQDAPVKFLRNNRLPIPMACEEGTLDQLWEFVNITDEDEQKLLVGFLLSCLYPQGPFPILILTGEQGTAKSTAMKIVRRLIDPCPAEGKNLPLKEDDLVVSAAGGWLLSGDNIGDIKADTANALCRLSTGGGLSKRKLYHDDEEHVIDAMRPIIITGINVPSQRPDFLDRSIVLTLERIDPKERRRERQLWADFEEVKPKLLAALYSALSTALERLPTIQLEETPRMADFIELVEAAAPSFGWGKGEFVEAYNQNKTSALQTAGESDLVSLTIRDWMKKRRKPYAGTASELLSALEVYRNSESPVSDGKFWPSNPPYLGKQLRKIAPSFEPLGIAYKTSRDGENYIIHEFSIDEAEEEPSWLRIDS